MDFFYLSQVLGRPVYTGADERVARVKDLVARLEALNATQQISLEAYPQISGLLVQIEGRDIFIPWQQVESLGAGGAYLSSSSIHLQGFQRQEGEVLLARDILDKQLIDIDGRRVIRANDLQLYSHDDAVRLAAVDVSAEALLRRLAYGKIFVGFNIHREPAPYASPLPGHRRTKPPSLIAWSDIEPLRSGVPDVRLRLSHERLARLHPVDLAHIADDLSRFHGAEIIASLDDETAADTLQEMDEERQADIVESMDQERAADILEEMDPDDAADLLGDLEPTQAEDLLRRMDREDAQDVEELLAYPEDSAGGMMTIDFLSVPEHLTIEDVIAFMRTLEDAPDLIDYLYVVEETMPDGNWQQSVQEGGGKLTGIVSLRDLLLSPGMTCLSQIMTTDFRWVSPHDSRDEAARMMTDYNLLALPVLDEDGRILGIITVDDAMEVLLPEPWLKRLPQVFG